MALSTPPAPSEGEEQREQTEEEMPRTDPPSDRSQGVQELSRLLLQGWTMMAETCPRESCHMPLARSRQGRVVCCNCGLDVVLAPSSPALPPPPDKPEEETEAQTEADQMPNGMSNAVVPATPRRAEREAVVERDAVVDASRRADRDAVSAALGEKLLQGWTMLERSCDRCAVPLLQDRGGRVICVACQGGEAESGAEAGASGSGQLMARVMDVAGGNDAGRSDGREVLRGRGDVVSGRARARSRERVVGRGVNVSPRQVFGDDIDVDEELALSEVEAGRALRRLRGRLVAVTEVEESRAIAVAMVEVAQAIRAMREARQAGNGGRL